MTSCGGGSRRIEKFNIHIRSLVECFINIYLVEWESESWEYSKLWPTDGTDVYFPFNECYGYSKFQPFVRDVPKVVFELDLMLIEILESEKYKDNRTLTSHFIKNYDYSTFSPFVGEVQDGVGDQWSHLT